MLFYTRDNAPFIPDRINPELAQMARATVKATKMTFKAQMKTGMLNNALKAGKIAQMSDLMQKCFEKNRDIYNRDMSLSGAVLGEVEDSFFADKDAEFYKQQLRILIDFAYINVVVESGLFPLMSTACEKTFHKKISEVFFFSNQGAIYNNGDEEDEETDTNTEKADTNAEADTSNGTADAPAEAAETAE